MNAVVFVLEVGILRLRKSHWAKKTERNYGRLIFMKEPQQLKGRWREWFGNDNPIYAEFGTGKGNFITTKAKLFPDINFIGVDVQEGVIYYAAEKALAQGVNNLTLVRFDLNIVLDVFAENELDKIYLNFSDPWPKDKHAKRRLTYRGFLEKYQIILKSGGKIEFKTDNRDLFDFSLIEFKEFGIEPINVTYDLHNSGMEGNVMTEYEEKFSFRNQPIHRFEGIVVK